MIGVEEAQALRHVVDRGVELEIAYPQCFFLLLAAFIFLLDARVEFLAFGDVLMRRDAAAIGQRADGVGDDAAVGEFLDRGVERDVAADALTDVIIDCDLHLQAEIQPVPNQFMGRCARLHLFRR